MLNVKLVIRLKRPRLKRAVISELGVLSHKRLTLLKSFQQLLRGQFLRAFK